MPPSEHKLRQAAFSAFAVAVRPLVRILLRCGVTWKEIAELLKAVYVDVASADYGKRGRPANASRVAILTGLSRRDVKRARDRLAITAPDAFAPFAKINHASRVLRAGFRTPISSTRRAKPRLLALTGDRGFEGLAKRYAPDIPSTALLKELKSVGAVAATPRDGCAPRCATTRPLRPTTRPCCAPAASRGSRRDGRREPRSRRAPHAIRGARDEHENRARRAAQVSRLCRVARDGVSRRHRPLVVSARVDGSQRKERPTRYRRVSNSG